MPLPLLSPRFKPTPARVDETPASLRPKPSRREDEPRFADALDMAAKPKPVGRQERKQEPAAAGTGKDPSTNKDETTEASDALAPAAPPRAEPLPAPPFPALVSGMAPQPDTATSFEAPTASAPVTALAVATPDVAPPSHPVQSPEAHAPATAMPDAIEPSHGKVVAPKNADPEVDAASLDLKETSLPAPAMQEKVQATPASPALAAAPPDSPAALPARTAPAQPLATADAPLIRLARPVTITDVPVAIAEQATGGERRFEIRLDPASLGRIEVRLDVAADGGVRTHIIVERPETLHMLRSDAPKLDQALAAAGVSADPAGIEFSLRSDTGSHRHPQRDGARPDQNSPATESDRTMPQQPVWLRISTTASALDLTL